MCVGDKLSDVYSRRSTLSTNTSPLSIIRKVLVYAARDLYLL
jgi:hypothetical protein